MGKVAFAWMLIGVGALLPAACPAAGIFLHIPGVDGENSTPGYPGAMAVQSVTVTPQNFTVTKKVDAASPQLFLACAQGTQLTNSSVLLYNGTPAGQPNGVLPFPNTLCSSTQSYLGPGDVMLEDVGFFSPDVPMAMYLEVPGITGESSTPGHSGVMQIASFKLTDNDFEVTKAIDTASPDIFLACAQGTHFSTVNVLFYNALVPGDQPDAVVSFQDVLISSYQTIDGRTELDGFNFATVAPEPAGCGAVFAAAGLASVRRRRRD